RAAVFGKTWDALPTADFGELRTLLVERGVAFTESDAADAARRSSTALALDDAVAAYGRMSPMDAEPDSEGDDRFTSQITFPTLLLHVLAIRRPESSSQRDDRQLDDKQLVSRFADRLSDLAPEDRSAWVRQFTTDLLRVRVLFDTYILKRDSTLANGHESTTDEEPGSWSLYRLSRGESRGGKGVPRYRPTFADDESGAGPGSMQRRILLLQSALRITYTSPRTMHWITDALRYVIECADRGAAVTDHGFLARLEAFSLTRLSEALAPRPRADSSAPATSPDGLPVGFALPRIVFTYLDYLLVEQMGKWDFTFADRTSLEHFSPQLEDSEHASEAFHVRDRARLDWLGNLALVTVSTNSKFSNYQPSEKANNQAARRQSLKLELMARQAQNGSWNDDDIAAHHQRMVALLRSALANRPITHDGRDLPAEPTGRHTE
ncbi:MAG: HNH endonuclease family protein, partial [Propionibacteriaceae bacterium]|nr:HNH endonuclease family protein [Propionibacteriaceae bacterium]